MNNSDCARILFMVYKDFMSYVRQNKIPKRSIYIFSGAENFLKDKGVEIIKSVLGDISEEISQFNQNDFDESRLLNDLYEIPFFSKHKLVILKLTGEQKSRKEIKETLKKYSEAPPFLLSQYNCA